MDDLENEIAKHLTAFTIEVEEGLQETQKKLARAGARKLRTTSPKDTGDYRKGWSSRKRRHGYVIYNRTDYQLTHLLEHGHAKVGGGRVAAIPHIKPVEDEIYDKFDKEIEKVLK